MKNKLPEENEDQILEEESYLEHYRVTIDRKQEPLRIDKFLFNRLENTSRNKIQIAADAGCVWVNGVPVKSNYKVKPGDEVKILLPERREPVALMPEPIDIEVVYEDNHVLVVNKQAGLVVHPGVGNYTGTLVNAVLHHVGQHPLPGDKEVRPGLVHRIDKNTSGLLVVAKTDLAMQHLAKQFYDHTVYRRYQALVWGTFNQPAGTITGNIARHARYRKLFDVYEDEQVGKHAVTHYTVMEHFGYVSLVECRLETGRTHQIRVHMQHIGHPLFNDETYGGHKIVYGTVHGKYKSFVDHCFQLIPRQALHAASLGFKHPETGQDLLFEAPVPPDFQMAVEAWKKYASGLNMPAS